MGKSLISTYFDFGQALEFMKDGHECSNMDYNPFFRIGLNKHTQKFYLTNWRILEENSGAMYSSKDVLAYWEYMENISIEDILCETWYIYDSKF